VTYNTNNFFKSSFQKSVVRTKLDTYAFIFRKVCCGETI